MFVIPVLFQLFFISIPLFYIIGLFTFISWLKKNSGKSKDETPIVEPSSMPKAEVLKSTVLPAPQKQPKSILHEDIRNIWSNWYSQNSINLLLYIGAFLIVVSVSIFVGFQWEVIGGNMKALLLSLLTVCFFIFGLWFLTIPKISLAGSTFTAIGSLLIPFCGLAWYNFSLQFMGISSGTVWLTTSLVGLCIYILLLEYIKSAFYSYAVSVGTLSTFVSIVHIYQLPFEMYIFTSIFTSFILFIAHFILRSSDETTKKIVKTPFQISSQIVMPLGLVFGIFYAASNHLLFTSEAATALLLGAVYYILSYYTFRKIPYLVTAQFLLPFSVVLYTQWLHFSYTNLLYTLSSISFVYLFSILLFKNYTTQKEKEITSIVALLISIFLIPVGLTLGNILPIHSFFFSFFPVVFSLLALYIHKVSTYLWIVTLFLPYAIHNLFSNVIPNQSDPYFVAFAYLLCTIFFYVLLIFYKKLKEYYQIFATTTILFFVLALTSSWGNHGYALIISSVTTAILSLASFQLDRLNLLYGASFFLYVTLMKLLSYFQMEIMFYPLAFTTVSYLLYFAKYVAPLAFKPFASSSGLIGIFLTPIIFSQYTYGKHASIEENALISAYFATILFTYHALTQKNKNLGYFASGIGMATYLWQMKILDISQQQIYTFAFAVYFMTLAYLKRLENRASTRAVLDYIGLGFLIFPTLNQSLAADGGMYALLLGVEGIAVIGMGISLKYNLYTYAGIFALVIAIITQTYEYLFSLPRWMITGITGFTFLIVALYLLFHRKESE